MIASVGYKHGLCGNHQFVFPRGHELGSHCCRCHLWCRSAWRWKQQPLCHDLCICQGTVGCWNGRDTCPGGHACWRLEPCHTGQPQLCSPCWVGFVPEACKEQLFQYWVGSWKIFQPRFQLELLDCFYFLHFLSTVMQVFIFSHTSTWTWSFKGVCVSRLICFCFPWVLSFLQKVCCPWEDWGIFLGFLWRKRVCKVVEI